MQRSSESGLPLFVQRTTPTARARLTGCADGYLAGVPAREVRGAVVDDLVGLRVERPEGRAPPLLVADDVVPGQLRVFAGLSDIDRDPRQAPYLDPRQDEGPGLIDVVHENLARDRGTGVGGHIVGGPELAQVARRSRHRAVADSP